ncbi:lipocalin family protein [Halobacteriovorax sp. HLS]|uniref:lipocalin family protein n=1 Tax=Halobacteriovorax sp. HLS TaxID=2234000 RepID=UPI000FDA2A9F|nr:lipocalin family protein [Halobacteriovorax sp. HLS]
MKQIILSVLCICSFSCSTKGNYTKTVEHIDLDRFLTKWYVIAGRLTMFEDGAHNAVESYVWNELENRVDINFSMRKGAFDGEIKSIPQKGWIENNKTNAYWKVSPFWPLKFDYLVIDLAFDYSWTVVGVPSQKWVWIMFKDWNISDTQLQQVVARVEKLGYSVKNIKRVPQKW